MVFEPLEKFDLEIRKTVLLALLNSSIPQSLEFWLTEFNRNLDGYSNIAFSAILPIDPLRAVELLHKLPDNEPTADVTFVNLNFTWDEVNEDIRQQLLQRIRLQLPLCNSSMREMLESWLEDKSLIKEV